MTDEAMRREFEATFQGFDCTRDPESPDDYLKMPEHFAWQAWQAATKAARSHVQEWQPIETAPKDKTLLVGGFNENGKWRTMRGLYLSREYIDEYFENPDMFDAGWYETAVYADDTDSCWLIPIKVTHWMTLPTAPEISHE